jgi:hypothetical protein
MVKDIEFGRAFISSGIWAGILFGLIFGIIASFHDINLKSDFS